jgi:1,4-dihydroxy-6-naphthoate synthase
MHTPDPDDAFAWWAIVQGRLTIPGCQVEVGAAHIQAINEMCLRRELDIAAISSAAYPLIAGDYAILSAGASVGRGYGPALATTHLTSPSELFGATVAVPGDLTTGALLLRLFFPGARTVAMPFDQVAAAVASGEVDAGVLIHEELLNWEAKGLHRLLCLGQEWQLRTGLPIPVGLNVVRRDLGPALAGEIAKIIREAMEMANRHPEAATAHAMGHSMEAKPGIAAKFIRMFANEDTLALDGECLTALRLLFRLARDRGLIDRVPTVAPLG